MLRPLLSSLLAYSMFKDVLFPPAEGSGNASNEAAVLTLRRLKRFLPEPALRFREAPVVVFDLETTGLDNQVDRIIEIGAQKYVGDRLVAELESFVWTDVELTDDIQRLTGITPDMLVGQPLIETVLPQFLEFIEGSLLVAHNAEFDIGMIRAACSRVGIDLEWPCFCTLKMARELLPDLENKKLDTLARHYGLAFEARHRAIGDIKVTAGVLAGMLAREGAKLQTWTDLQPFHVASV